MNAVNTMCSFVPCHSSADPSQWSWQQEIWAAQQTVLEPAGPDGRGLLKEWWAAPGSPGPSFYAEAGRTETFHNLQTCSGKFEKIRFFRELLIWLTSNIWAKWVSLLVNIALMQWMAYLACRGGPLFALACSTGSRTLEGARRRKSWHSLPECEAGNIIEKKILCSDETYDFMWGKLSSILLPVFLKICSAASATFSSSIFRQPSKDSKVSAEWKDTGCVKDSTCAAGGKVTAGKWVTIK